MFATGPRSTSPTASSSSECSSCSAPCSSHSGGMTDRSPSPSHTVRVPDDAAGGRLDRFLAELPEIGSRSAAERLLADGAVRVDGVTRAKSHRLEGGEEIEVTLPEPATALVEAEEVP